jgi:hypothetical protein
MEEYLLDQQLELPQMGFLLDLLLMKVFKLYLMPFILVWHITQLTLQYNLGQEQIIYQLRIIILKQLMLQ